MKYLIFVLFVALVLISGCAQQEKAADQEPVKEEYPTPETIIIQENLTNDTEALKEVIEEEKSKEIKKKIKEPEMAIPEDGSLGGLCDSPMGCFSYCQQSLQECLDYCAQHQTNSLCQMMKSMLGLDYSKATPTSKTTGTTDVAKFVNTNFIDLDSIERISKFRGGYGHDYSEGSPEECRSMKHYFWAKGGMPGSSHSPAWTTVKYYSPVDGKISFLRPGTDSDGQTEYYFTIIPDEQSSYYLSFFHVNLLSEFQKGGSVKEGQHIGYLSDEYVHGEIAVQKGLGGAPISFFNIITDDLFEEYKKGGAKTREDFIIPKEDRDKKSLNCDPNTKEGRFIGVSIDGLKDSTGLNNWVELN